jgi:prepilin-type N-terminal cleavage/methylation domain-containing protein
LSMGRRHGFTLIELVIVIAIIGILASLAVPKFINMSSTAQIAATKGGLGTLRAILATRYAASATGGATASYPTALAASDFASGNRPINKLRNGSEIFWDRPGVTALTATTSGDAGSSDAGFWYVSLSSSADYGKAGAYSNVSSGGGGPIDTSSW